MGITHLFFAADSLLFYNPSIGEVREIKKVLEDYCHLSGQLANFNKSAVYFSNGSGKMICNELCKLPGVRKMGEKEKYLGNPLISNRNESSNF